MDRIYIVVLFLFTVFLIGCTSEVEPPVVELTEQEQCAEDGGRWQYGPSEPESRCILPYADAGESCTSSDQCLGDCVTNVISNLGVEGTCQEEEIRDNCYNAVENERFECLLDDIIFVCNGDNPDPYCDDLKDDLFFE
tara:strand:- start:831 stop:1244 length:414 start_codon:yes stop_codon:yes gene_type:complete